MKKSFSTSEALRVGWDLTKKNFLLYFGIGLIMWGITLLPNLLNYILTIGQKSDSTSIQPLAFFIPIASLVATIASNYVGFGANQVYLLLVDGKGASVKDVLVPARLFVGNIVAALIVAFMVVIGFLLLIIPGIILGLKFQFFSLLIIDRKLGPVEAMKMSSRLTSGVKVNLFLFGLVMLLVNLGGLLLLGVGLLATIPTTTFAFIHVYRKLLAQTEGQLPQ